MKYLINNGKTANDYDEIYNEMSSDELLGQLLCYDIYEKDDPSDVEKNLQRLNVGGIFISSMPADKIKLYTDMANKYSPIPVIVAADIENGPEQGVKGGGLLPYPMAWGACGDERLIKEAGKLTARICRKGGIHWTFAPIVDMNLNFRSPETNIRAVSDSPDAVIKFAGAYSDGLRSEGLMVTGAKHFPGAGTDERNSHFCTTLNNLSKEDWMAGYGKIYREMFKKGTDSVMAGHYSLPAFMKEKEKGLPCILSKSLMSGLLRGELGFTGCIVSDAMSMIGACASMPCDRLVDEYIKAGGDMVLFPETDDKERIKQAVLNGEISRERIKDAVFRILKLKENAGLFEKQKEIPYADNNMLLSVAQKIADKSIKVVKDENKIIPCGLKDGDKILIVSITEPYWHAEPTFEQFTPIKERFEKYGVKVDYLVNPKHKTVKEVMNNYNAVIAVCDMSSKNYHGGSLRVGWYNIMTFWRAYILEHPKFIFVSLGDPYKLFDFPYLKEYVNTFSDTKESQIALVDVLMGKIEAKGKNPVSFEGFFEREI